MRQFALSLALVALPVWADTIPGRVVGVSDGDTVTVLASDNRQIKVRLAGIDAPEKAQPFGQKSKDHLAALVHSRTVSLECGKADRYGRSVCVVRIDGKDANIEQVRAGLAWWYRKYSGEQSPQDRASYEEAETRARESRAGLWRDPAPVPPWEWRKARR